MIIVGNDFKINMYNIYCINCMYEYILKLSHANIDNYSWQLYEYNCNVEYRPLLLVVFNH